MKNKPLSSGFTLLEFLIAFALSAFILTGAYKIYITLIDHYYITQTMTNIEHRAQMAYLIFKKNISLAGDASCLSAHIKENLNPILFYQARLIDKKSGTDALSLQRCIHFKNKMTWKDISFFIRNSHRKTTNNLPIFSLYRKIGSAPSEELISGISYMDICYITAENNHSSPCLKANQLTQQKNIRGIHIKLLLDALIPIRHPLAFYFLKNTQQKILHKNIFIIAPIEEKENKNEKRTW